MNMNKIFVPYNIESRKEKLKQINLKMLQSEVIEGDLLIDKFFIFNADQVKVRLIKGNVILVVNLGYIPEWLKNVRIEGHFDVRCCDLFSLKNCPQYINRDFRCNNNELISLKYGPKYVGGDYMCYSNKIKFTVEIILDHCSVKNSILN